MLQVDNETAVGADRAEILAKAFVKIHSSENLSPEAKICREKTIEQNLGIRNKRPSSGEDIDLLFNLYELRKAIANAKQTVTREG